MYIREDIPARLPTTSLPKDVEGFFVELNLREKKILMRCSYNPAKSNISSHLSIAGKSMGSYILVMIIFQLLETLIQKLVK